MERAKRNRKLRPNGLSKPVMPLVTELVGSTPLLVNSSQSAGRLPGIGLRSSAVRTMPLPAASASFEKNPAQPSVMVSSGAPLTVASKPKRNSQVSPWRKKSWRRSSTVPVITLSTTTPTCSWVMAA